MIVLLTAITIITLEVLVLPFVPRWLHIRDSSLWNLPFLS